MHATTLEPGVYIIGDPCNVIDTLHGDNRADWLQFLQDIDDESGVVEYHGYRCIAYRTSRDGYAHDNQHNLYPVDSGIISAIPIAALSPESSPRQTPPTNREVTFHTRFQCIQDEDGTIHLGDIAITVPAP